LPEFTGTKQAYEDSKEKAVIECYRIGQRVLQFFKC